MPGGIPKADRGAWGKKCTVIGGRKGQFWRYWQRRRSLRHDFESLTTMRLQRRLEFASSYPKRCVQKLPTRYYSRWSRTGGRNAWEANAPPPTIPRFTIHTAICELSDEVRWNEDLPYPLKINDTVDVIVTFIQIYLGRARILAMARRSVGLVENVRWIFPSKICWYVFYSCFSVEAAFGYVHETDFSRFV